MVSDLIDRQALLKQIEIDSEGCKGSYGDCWEFMDTINNMPSAEPQERKIGEWIYDWGDWDFETCKCSECGNHMTTPIGVRYSFCPNCGAKMEVTE